jgi:predicted ferric reductase
MKPQALFSVMAALIILPVTIFLLELPSGMEPSLYVYSAGQLFALVGFVLIFLQYVLSSKLRCIERGIGLDRLFRIHSICGKVGLILLVIHPIFFFISERMQGYKSAFGIFKLVGLLAIFLLLLVSAIATLSSFIRIKYELWKNIHRASYIILPLGFFHSIMLGSTMRQNVFLIYWIVLAAGYAAILLYKAVRLVHRRSHPYRVSDVPKRTHDTWSLILDGPPLEYTPGQFLIINLKRNGCISEPHPFTISSSPTREKLEITVKSVGDFTSTLGETKPGDLAYVDAPYGRFSFLNYDGNSLVFIAGGIGITPFISMLRYILDREPERHILLLWGNKREQDIVFKEEMEQLIKRMPRFRVAHVLSQQEEWGGEKGYIDSELLQRYIGQYEKSQFFICGPPPMLLSVRKKLKNLGVPRKHIHYERFSLQ